MTTERYPIGHGAGLPDDAPSPERDTMTEHEVKSWPPFWEAIANGRKTGELRRNDRGYGVGDVLVLREWDPERENYTGRECRCVITDVTSLGDWVRPVDDTDVSTPRPLPEFVLLSVRLRGPRVAIGENTEPEIVTSDEARAAVVELGAWLMAGWPDALAYESGHTARQRIANVSERIGLAVGDPFNGYAVATEVGVFGMVARDGGVEITRDGAFVFGWTLSGPLP